MTIDATRSGLRALPMEKTGRVTGKAEALSSEAQSRLPGNLPDFAAMLARAATANDARTARNAGTPHPPPAPRGGAAEPRSLVPKRERLDDVVGRAPGDRASEAEAPRVRDARSSEKRADPPSGSGGGQAARGNDGRGPGLERGTHETNAEPNAERNAQRNVNAEADPNAERNAQRHVNAEAEPSGEPPSPAPALPKMTEPAPPELSAPTEEGGPSAADPSADAEAVARGDAPVAAPPHTESKDRSAEPLTTTVANVTPAPAPRAPIDAAPRSGKADGSGAPPARGQVVARTEAHAERQQRADEHHDVRGAESAEPIRQDDTARTNEPIRAQAGGSGAQRLAESPGDAPVRQTVDAEQPVALREQAARKEPAAKSAATAADRTTPSPLASGATRAAGSLAQQPSRLARAETVEQQFDQRMRARRQQAVDTATNRIALRHGASGSIELPDLGTVRVAARMRSGEVDVDVRAQRADTVAVLQSAGAALEAALRQGAVNLRHVDIDQEPTTDESADSEPRDPHERSGSREPSEQRPRDEQQDAERHDDAHSRRSARSREKV